MSSKNTGNCGPCCIKDKHVTAYVFCPKCEEHSCQTDRDNHMKQLISKGHLVKVWREEMLEYFPATNISRHGTCNYDQCGGNNFQSDAYDFEADILENGASKHCHLSGKCTVRLDSCSIAITEIASHVTICWPFTCIRKFGSMDNKIFFFESGRRCDSGEGRYVLLTHDAVSLHRHMTNFIRLIEKNTHF